MALAMRHTCSTSCALPLLGRPLVVNLMDEPSIWWLLAITHSLTRSLQLALVGSGPGLGWVGLVGQGNFSHDAVKMKRKKGTTRGVYGAAHHEMKMEKEKSLEH